MKITERDVRHAIHEAVPKIDVEAIPDGKNFYSAGLDSLDHAMILLRLQEQFGLDVPDEKIGACSSIRAILEYAGQTPPPAPGQSLGIAPLTPP